MTKSTYLTIISAVELVQEGLLTWDKAALELRDEFGWTIRDLYIRGAIDMLQAADTAFMARRRAICLIRSFTNPTRGSV